MASAKFYSTKLVTAWPEYHAQQGPGWRLTYQDGYSSWCPDAVFLRDYQPITAMSFGHAIAALKAGERVARAGWNGKGMWLALTPGSTISSMQARSGAALARATEDPAPDTIAILPHIDMRAADGSIVIGWLASQTDMLADDWQVVT
jgi:hypothetical protein